VAGRAYPVSWIGCAGKQLPQNLLDSSWIGSPRKQLPWLDLLKGNPLGSFWQSALRQLFWSSFKDTSLDQLRSSCLV